MEELEGYINDLERILGNSDRLRSGRGRREEATLPVYFDNFREQATNLHKAICRSLRCACPGLHSSQLLLWRSYDNSMNTYIAGWPILKVYFPRRSQRWSQNPKVMQPDNDWFASDIEIAKRSDTRACESDIEISERPVVLDDAVEIIDLCAALKIANHCGPCLGYLLSDDNKRVIIHKSGMNNISPSSVRRVVKLRELIQQSQESAISILTRRRLPRVTRLSVAIKMVEVVLQLFDTPWLRDTWDKDDIFFL